MLTRKRRAIALAAILAVAVAAAATVALSSGSPTHPGQAAGRGVPAGQTTAEVTRRTLSESATVDGTLGYGATLELYDRLAGTFTWLPSVGATIGRGGTLWRIDDRPVVLMYGSVPAYRTLQQGVGDGPDVAELNENLIDLGYDPYGTIGEDYEHFGQPTAAAVGRWQHAEGLTETGQVELGRVVFAPGARRVTAVKVALGQDPPGSTGATGPVSTKPSAPKNPSPSKKTSPKKPSSKRPPPKKPSSKKPAGGEASKKEPAAKESDSGEAPAKEPSSREPAAGKDQEPSAGASAGEVALSTTSTQQLVTLALKAEQQTLAHLGETAPVTLPGDRVVRGRITDVGTVAEAKASEPSGEKGGGSGGGSGGESEAATIKVTLALERPVARLDAAPVSVELLESIRHDVLAVPATALTATAGGGYAIEVLRGGRHAALAVTPGMFANGYVQVEGPGVREGLTVIESE